MRLLYLLLLLVKHDKIGKGITSGRRVTSCTRMRRPPFRLLLLLFRLSPLHDGKDKAMPAFAINRLPCLALSACHCLLIYVDAQRGRSRNRRPEHRNVELAANQRRAPDTAGPV